MMSNEPSNNSIEPFFSSFSEAEGNLVLRQWKEIILKTNNKIEKIFFCLKFACIDPIYKCKQVGVL